MTDAIQHGLSQHRFLACLLLALALLQGFRLLSGAWSLLRVAASYVVPFWKIGTAIKTAVIACALWLFSGAISDALQYIEQYYLNPVYYTTTAPDTLEMLAQYEAEIRKHTDGFEFDVLKNETEKTAVAIGSTPLAIYETAYLECGLNPFRVRDDGVAAGWIQFTRAGLAGLDIDGQKYTLEQVRSACRARDIRLIMRLTDAYLKRKHERAGRIPLNNGIDLYLAVFAPAHIGAPPEQIVYEGRGNPAYDLNSGLDGWEVDGGKIVRGRCDGRITVFEIFLCLTRKKIILCT